MINEKSKNLLLRLYRFSNSWTGTVIIVLMVIFFVAQAFVIPSGSMISTMLIGDHLFVKKFAYGVSTPRIPWVEVPILPDSDDDGHLIAGERPQRGDIVIFRYPHNEKIHYVKRCVATSQDEVMYIDRHLLLHPYEGDDYIRKHYPKEQIIQLAEKLWVIDPYLKEHPGVHYDNSLSYEQMILHAMHGNLPMYPIKIQAEIDGKSEHNAFYFRVPEEQYFMMGDNRDHSNDSRFWGPVPYKYIVGKPWFIYFSWDDDYLIRWERIGMSMESLEKDLMSQPDRYDHENVSGLH